MPFETSARTRPEQPFVGAVQSHKGLVRANNEDSYVFDVERGRFAVIDGMGGQRAGEIAAGLQRDWLLRKDDLARAIFEANREIFSRSARNENERGMGCVVTAVQVDGDRLRLAHVGDTRAYLARASGCRLLTRDHTTANDRQQSLALSDSAARKLPGQHQVTRDVGGVRQPDASWVVTGHEPFEPDDLLLLCSDGLHDLVSSDELYAHLRQAREAREDPPQLVHRLIRLALERGGKDNVTVLAVRREAEGRRRRRLRSPRLRASLLVAGMATLPFAGALAYEMGQRYWPLTRTQVGASECLADSAGLAHVSSESGLVRAKAAGLDGRWVPGVLQPLGALQARGGDQETIIAPHTSDGASSPVTLRGLSLGFPATGRHLWRVRVQPGAVLELLQASIRAPNLELQILLEGPGSAVRIVDSHLEVGRLTVIGDAASAGSVQLQGGHVAISRTRQVLVTNPGPLQLQVPFDSAPPGPDPIGSHDEQRP